MSDGGFVSAARISRATRSQRPRVLERLAGVLVMNALTGLWAAGLTGRTLPNFAP
jgi:hypothetical protein